MKKSGPKAKSNLKKLFIILGFFLLLPGLQVGLIRFIDPPTTMPMICRWAGGRFGASAYQANCFHWVRLQNVAGSFLADAWIMEDASFFKHWGFDWKAIQAVRREAKASGKPPRGASTITQQCARSLFLWQGRSWFRKGLEAYYTFWMELLLSKERILELYVNVIELGDGVYGIDAAAQKYYGVSADKLTEEQAAMLVAILPNPKKRNPNQPSELVLRRQHIAMERTEYVELPPAIRK